MLREFLFGRHPRRTALRALAIVAASAILFGVLLRPVRTHGISMLPAITDNELVFVNTLVYVGVRSPQRGDVVGIRLAGERVLYLKRIVGLPFERVRIDAGEVHIDDRPLPEPYVAHRAPWQYDEIQLGPDEYFAMGDNRGMRQELHDFGRVRRSRILGKVVF